MLAVLDKSIAKSPEALQIPHSSDSISALKDGFVAQHFSSLHSASVTINLGASALMAYSIDRQNPLLPRFNTHFPILAYFPAFFVFILYAGSSKITFIAVDADESVPFFWGNDSEGHLVLADDAETVKKVCGKYFVKWVKINQVLVLGPMRCSLRGCFFTSSGGLRNFEHPLNELKPVPRVDSSDAESRKDTTGMHRVGSAANWSENY
ncbi:hypothetical protein CsSME_00020848 [Camellia sinensis var. sinensis]